jgi:hypothetical protein
MDLSLAPANEDGGGWAGELGCSLNSFALNDGFERSTLMVTETMDPSGADVGEAPPRGPLRRSPILQMECSLWRCSPPTTLALAIAVMVEGTRTSSMAVVGQRARALGTPCGWAVTRLNRHGTPASTPRSFGKRVVLEAGLELGLPLGIEACNGGLKAGPTWEHENGQDLEGETELDDKSPGSWMLMRSLESGCRYRMEQSPAALRCATVPVGGR